ncbi:hypothetical protein Avbf_06376, partial [Armadillidium vulgare]
TIPPYFIWLRYISWFNYGFEALAIAQWKDITDIQCDVPYTCEPTGVKVIEDLGYDPGWVSSNTRKFKRSGFYVTIKARCQVLQPEVAFVCSVYSVQVEENFNQGAILQYDLDEISRLALNNLSLKIFNDYHHFGMNTYVYYRL